MDLESIHQGFVSATNTLPLSLGSMTVKLQALASVQAESITPPTLAPAEFAMDYHQTFKGGTPAGLTAVTITLGLFTSVGDTDSGRKMLLGYLAEGGSSSVLQAIEADKTLGGACRTLMVDRVHGAYRLYEVSAIQYLGAMIDVKVWA